MFEPLADFAEELDASANATRIPSASMPIEPVPIAPMNEDFDLGADFGGEGHEDAVEVVENPSDLLPPAAVKAWLPQAGAPQAGQPTPGQEPGPAPGQAPSGKPMPSNTPTEDDDDITAFLRSLKK